MLRFDDQIMMETYEAFANKSKYASFMQDYHWAQVKSDNWDYLRFGLYDDDALVGVGLMLIKDAGYGIRLGYIPRGPLLDLNRTDYVDALTTYLKRIAKQKGLYAITLEPNYCLENYRFSDHTPVVSYASSNKVIINNLTKNGFKYQGLITNVYQSIQPQFNMVVPLVADYKALSLDEVTNSLSRKMRYYVTSYPESRGLYFETSSDKQALDAFMLMIKKTEQRQKIILRNKAYFERMMDEYGNQVKIILGYVDLNKYLQYLEANKNEAKIKEVKTWLQKDDKILLSAALLLLPNNDGIRMSEYLYAGNDLDYKEFNASMAMVYEAIKLSLKAQCDYCNLGGVDGHLNDHLANFKAKFNPLVFVYMGEYDLVFNHFKYFLVKKIYPLIKRISL